ncbi:MAG: P-loop NTPase [Candidatus Polarisedimenticolia bacterium]
MKSYFDIAGDGGSNIVGQVMARRDAIDARLAGVKHMVAIGSGKGGVGKSTLTMQLALALAKDAARVAILDADLNGPSQARLGGLAGSPLVPTREGLSVPTTTSGIGVMSLGTMIPESQALEFDTVASGESHVWRGAREFAALSDLLAIVEWGKLDYLLIDLPPGADRTFQYAEFFGERTSFVLVTIPSQLSRGVVARSVASLRKAPNRLLGYIENMKGYHCATCNDVKPLFPVTGELDLGIPCLGSVPFDPELSAASDAGGMVGGEDRPSSAATRSIASRLAHLLEAQP